MSLLVANAPCSWGVDFAEAPTNPPWQRVVEEIAEAGYRATELGPYGYLPIDPARLVDVLREHDLQVVAGTLFRPFEIQAERAATLNLARDTCALLSNIGGQYLVVIDAFDADRVRTAGQSNRACRLATTDWKILIETIHDASRAAFYEFGIVPVLHAHVGTHLEFEDEVNRALDELPAGLVKLCVDTGHMTYAGMDPAIWIRSHRDRLAFLHLKDIAGSQLTRVTSENVDFWAAVASGVFCPLGTGIVDFVAIRSALEDIGYGGWAVVEQDCDPQVEPSPLRDARQSHEFLRSVGLARPGAERTSNHKLGLI